MPKFLGASLGTVAPQGGTPIRVDVNFEATASALWDAAVLPAGTDAQTTLQADERVLEFVKEQYRHCKLIVALGDLDTLLAAVAMRATLEDLKSDPGIIMVRDSVSATNPKDAQAAKPATKSSAAKNNGVFAADSSGRQ